MVTEVEGFIFFWVLVDNKLVNKGEWRVAVLVSVSMDENSVGGGGGGGGTVESVFDKFFIIF